VSTPGGLSWQGGWDEPGVLSVVLIAAGTSGSGLFVYSGTPAAGNLIYSITAAATGTDLFGNATLGGATSYGPTLPSGFQAVEISNGQIIWSTAATLAGPWTAGPVINGENNGQFTIDTSTAATDVQLAMAANLWQVNAPSEFGSLTGVQFVPGTGLLAMNSSVAETWHSMTLLNSWANVAGFAVAKYRLVASPPNSVEIIGAIDATAATAATFFTLPSGYIPADKQPVCAAGENLAVPAGRSPWIQCDASGNLSVQNTGALGAWESFFHGFISLDA